MFFALLYFLDSIGLVASAVPAVLVHEAGHYIALRLCGNRLRRVRVSVFGIEMDYAGELQGGKALLCAAAGPIFGLLYAVTACTLGTEFLRMSGSVSFLLSVFNLMPALPLDGGRIVAAITDDVPARKLSRCVAAVLLAAGIVFAVFFGAWGLLGMGLWLTIRNFRV